MSEMQFFACGQEWMIYWITWMRSCRTCGWYCRCCPCPASSGARGSWSPPAPACGTFSRSSPSWEPRAGGSCGRTPWALAQTTLSLSPSGSRTWGTRGIYFPLSPSRDICQFSIRFSACWQWTKWRVVEKMVAVNWNRRWFGRLWMKRGTSGTLHWLSHPNHHTKWICQFLNEFFLFSTIHATEKKQKFVLHWGCENIQIRKWAFVKYSSSVLLRK